MDHHQLGDYKQNIPEGSIFLNKFYSSLASIKNYTIPCLKN